MKIMIGIPFGRTMDYQAVQSLLQLANLRGPNEYVFALVSNSLVYDAREKIAQLFLESECEFLFFLDSDMTFHPQTVDLLVRHNLQFVTAKAFKRVAPFMPCFYTRARYENGKPELQVPIEYGAGLLPIEGAGLACALIRRDVFEQLESPYFFPLPNMGEDLAFCLKLQEAGVLMYADTTVTCGHITSFEVFEEHFQAHRDAAKASGQPLEESR